LPLLRYSAGLTGPNIILTKLDVFDGVELIKICAGYKYVGPDYVHGGHVYSSGDLLHAAVIDLEVMKHCEPCYEELSGWKGPIRGMRGFGELPRELQNVVLFIEQHGGVNVTILSVGPDREETIFVKSPR